MLKPGARTILIADLRGLSSEDFAPVSASPHNPVVIAIRDGSSAGMVDALMLEGEIHALVDAPVDSPAMLRAVNDAARISATADALSAVTNPSSSSSGGSEEKSGKSPVVMIGVAVAVLALAGAGWFFMSKGSPEPEATAAGSATPAASASGEGCSGRRAAAPAASLDEVLEKARLAMDERRYIEPAKNNALEHFRQVLVLDPKNAEATEGLKRLGGLLIARARTALDERRFDNALAELEAARSIDPNDPRLVEVDARLDSMRAQTALAQIQATLAAQNFDRAQTLARGRAERCAAAARADCAAVEGTRRQAPLGDRFAAWWRSAESRLANGRLVTPADESAKDAIKALREAGASNELVARLNADLNQRLLAAARDAAARGDKAAMQANLAAARDNGVSAAALNAAQRDVTAATQKQQRTTEDIARFAKAAQERLASGSLLTPANDSAVSHAERLRLLDARNPTTVQVVRDVRARLLTEARATPQRQQADRGRRAARCRGEPGWRCRPRRTARRAGQRPAGRCGGRRRSQASAAQDDAPAASEVSVRRQGRRRLGARRVLRDAGRPHGARARACRANPRACSMPRPSMQWKVRASRNSLRPIRASRFSASSSSRSDGGPSK